MELLILFLLILNFQGIAGRFSPPEVERVALIVILVLLPLQASLSVRRRKARERERQERWPVPEERRQVLPEAWRDIAGEVGWKAGGGRVPRLVASVRGRTVTATVLRSGGLATRVRTKLSGGQGATLAVLPSDTDLGGARIDLNDGEFDDHFAVTSTSSELLGRVLTTEVRAMLIRVGHCELWLEKHEVRLLSPGFESREERLMLLFDLVATVATRALPDSG